MIQWDYKEKCVGEAKRFGKNSISSRTLKVDLIYYLLELNGERKRTVKNPKRVFIGNFNWKMWEWRNYFIEGNDFSFVITGKCNEAFEFYCDE